MAHAMRDGMTGGMAQPMADGLRARVGTAAAFAGVRVVGLASTITAVAYTGTAGEGYSPLNHWISELGEPGVSQLAILFNAAVMVGGASFSLFMAMLASSMTGQARRLWGPLGIAAGIAGVLVGVFPMSGGLEHGVAASAFFGFGLLAVATATIDVRRRRDRRFPRSLGIVAALAMTACAAFLIALAVDPVVAVDGLGAPTVRPELWSVAILEWTTLGLVLAWTAHAAWSWRRAG